MCLNREFVFLIFPPHNNDLNKHALALAQCNILSEPVKSDLIYTVHFRYGDKAPRSFGARLFGIVWILVGLVIISTFTATITTMLTTSSLSDETKLYGTKVGVLHNSEEYRLGVKRNAETKGL